MKLTINRGNYLTLRIMLALSVVAPLVSPFWHAWVWTRDGPLVWLNRGSPSQTGLGEATSPLKTANGLIVRPSLETLSWEFTDPTWTQRLGTMPPGVLVAMVTLQLCVIIWRFMLLMQCGRALSAGVHRLLVQLGIALIFLIATFLIGEVVANILIYTDLPARGMGSTMLTINTGDFTPLKVVLMVLITAYTWRQGEQLAGDTETTIRCLSKDPIGLPAI